MVGRETQPDADAVVHKHLESVTAFAMEDARILWVGATEDGDDPAERSVRAGAHVHRLDRKPQRIDSDHRSTSRIQVAHSLAELTGQMIKTLAPLR